LRHFASAAFVCCSTAVSIVTSRTGDDDGAVIEGWIAQ
jgi:hypothetical protein